MRTIKRMLVLLLCLVLTVSGCKTVDKGEGKKEKGNNVQSTQKEMTGMYCEEILNIPQEMREPVLVTRQNDGSLRMLGIDYEQENEGMEVFELTNGETEWSDKTPDWFLEWKKGKYILSYAQSHDKSMVFGYAEEGKKGYLFVDSEGKRIELDLRVSGRKLEEDNFIKCFDFSEDNRLFAMDIGSTVYEVDIESGEMKVILEAVSSGFMKCSKNMLMILGMQRMYLYDLNSENLLEQDKVLEEFINSKSDRYSGNDRNISDVIVTLNEDNALYLLCRGGIYRHIIGGASMELVVDGNRNSLSEPDIMFADFICMEDGSFRVLTSDGRFLKYFYDEDATYEEVKEEDTIKIFSLTESHFIRTAISLFQRENPNRQVVYEVGVTKENGITREDAIKNLNTAIMSGDGPDIIVMDNLSEKAFIEKGILRDLSEDITQMEQEDGTILLSNIKAGYENNGKIYTLPCQFKVPFMAGAAQEVEEVKDLLSLAKKSEELRSEKADGKIFGLIVPEFLLETLIPVCMGAWQTTEGTLNEAALEEFFSCVKCIYDADSGEMAEEEVRQIEEIRAFMNENPDVSYSIGNYALGLLTKEEDMILGPLSGIKSQFSYITSVMKQMEGGDFGVLNGQQSQIFIPQTIIGMNAQKEATQAVTSFMKFLFSNEVQKAETDYGEGFPVNKQIFEEIFIREKPEGEVEYSIAASGEDGNVISLDIYFPSEEELYKAKTLILALNVPAENNYNLKQAVMNAGLKLLNKELDVKDAVQDVVEKMELYLAE